MIRTLQSFHMYVVTYLCFGSVIFCYSICVSPLFSMWFTPYCLVLRIRKPQITTFTYVCPCVFVFVTWALYILVRYTVRSQTWLRLQSSNLAFVPLVWTAPLSSCEPSLSTLIESNPPSKSLQLYYNNATPDWLSSPPRLGVEKCLTLRTRCPVTKSVVHIVHDIY